MRKILTFLLFTFSLGALDIQLSSDSAILINADTGAIIFEKNSRKKQYPASLTKIATAHYTLLYRDNKLDKKLAAERDCVASISDEEMKRSNYTLPSYWLTPGATHIGIKVGEELAIEDLLYGTMLASGGDSSNVLANYMGGSIPVFMDELNAYLKEIGLKDTHLKNPHGLHHPDHQSTAYDLALLTKEAMKHPKFREIVKTVTYKRPETNKQPSTTLVQGNRLLKKGKYYYSKAIGVKTGYTSIARNCLAAAAADGDRTLIAILLKAPGRDEVYADAVKLFKKAFEEKPVQRKLVAAGAQKTQLSLDHSATTVKTYTANPIIVEYYPSEEPKLKCTAEWDEVCLPVEKDQKVGVLTLKDEGGYVYQQEPLYAQNSVDYSMWYKWKSWFTAKFLMKILAAVLALFLIGGLFYELFK